MPWGHPLSFRSPKAMVRQGLPLIRLPGQPLARHAVAWSRAPASTVSPEHLWGRCSLYPRGHHHQADEGPELESLALGAAARR